MKPGGQRRQVPSRPVLSFERAVLMACSLLAEHMLEELAVALGVPRKRFSPAAADILAWYDWPGNVRELGNVIQREYVLCDKLVIDADDLPETPRDQGLQQDERFLSLQEDVRQHVRDALELSGGIRSGAARLLGIDRTTLWRMTHRYNIG